ncbi:class I SAM-dependent methyltransferase [Corallococcus sp. BB11-1]|uniref:class I SAM-dependent DNA methyltransferase n=1 Tax=Corallococcus sp. BB11-1 TaxID=2996783 RepID=UPI0022711821|nr:class I SAM-dependent methyltransferase [Corallococcus sp. BB11-1]MCY1031273.1 class I SAM-dependent methyltransferase [Corallococcus sp. BB11-1]
MMRLFDEFAHRYDLHTPPGHYQHDHDFVLEMLRSWAMPCYVLDVGCGTGAFLEKALRSGMRVQGVDASPGMVREAERRLGRDVVTVQRMQELEAQSTYHAIVSLSWTINYCESYPELVAVLRRFHRALRPGGGVVLQIAHASHAPVEVMEDREPGPGGKPEDILFLYRFHRLPSGSDELEAQYVYACKSLGEMMHERHLLRVADARAVVSCAQNAGFEDVQLFNSFRRDAFSDALSPFLVARKPGGGEG